MTSLPSELTPARERGLPRIALLIPCYNVEAFLPDLLADARAQTVPFAEVICYDDGSTDRTSDVARDFGCRLIASHENRGPAFARNRLLAATPMPWVHFHDADDRLQPRFVEAFSARLSEQGVDAAAWFCATRRQDLSTRWHEDLRYTDLPVDTDWCAFHLTSFLSHIQIVFPRAAVLAEGGYDERLVSGEDVNLHIRLASAGLDFRYIDELLVTQNCGRISSLGNSTPSVRRLRDTLLSCQTLRPRLPARYHANIVSTLSSLAVHFSSLQLRAEMELAISEALTLCPARQVPQSRTAMRWATRWVGFERACRTRYLLVGIRDRVRQLIAACSSTTEKSIPQ